MSIKVHKLTKLYGRQRAIDGVSFQAGRGEILGFLGPNGAGKTTTMKILTCFLPQTSGTAEVCGFNVRESSLEVRRCVGYLPEHNPLYKDMYVREYLHFVAGLHRVKNRSSRVAEMIKMTGLEKEQHKRVNALSKGYRQRLGLAQAIVHDPEVLILDEPTSGLDPNQLAEIRQLIKNIGREKTVIFSTHIMQEVQALCSRVLIINQGKIVADDPIGKLQSRARGERVITVEFKGEVLKEQLEKIEKIKSVKALGNHRWQLTSGKNYDIRPAIFNFAVARGVTLLELHQEQYSVEDVFQELTR